MRVALLSLGVVVGWAASGVDWSRSAIGDDTAELTGPPAQAVVRVPDPFSSNGQWPRRVWETRIEVDANGQQHPVKASRLVNADGTLVPETPPGLIGRFQATAYGSPSGHGCYIVDTMTGKTWQVANGQPPQVVTEALMQPAAQPTTPAYYAPPLTNRPEPKLTEPTPERRDVESPTINRPVPQLAEPDDAN